MGDEVSIIVKLTRKQHDKLLRLAKARGSLTMQDCIRDFIDTCQPEGGGWVHPALRNVIEKKGKES